jgi:hypothetical protein
LWLDTPARIWIQGYFASAVQRDETNEQGWKLLPDLATIGPLKPQKNQSRNNRVNWRESCFIRPQGR